MSNFEVASFGFAASHRHFKLPTVRDKRELHDNISTMRSFHSALLVLLGFLVTSSLQFDFFNQMFGGGGQQQQREQNVPSDSNWYRQNHDAGMCFSSILLRCSLCCFPAPSYAVARTP
jgi:hypothetical protein